MEKAEDYVQNLNRILLNHKLRGQTIQDMVTKINILADLPTQFFDQLLAAEEHYFKEHPEQYDETVHEWLRRFKILRNFKVHIQQGYWSLVQERPSTCDNIYEKPAGE